MPFVRCKFYTENGEPLKGGCRRKGAGCNFIHPGDPDWDKAPPPSFKARDKSGNSGGFKSWSGKRGTTAPSSWDSGGIAGTSSTDTAGNWGDGSGWGGSGRGTASDWDTGSGWGSVAAWDTGSGWGAEGSSSTPHPLPGPAIPGSPIAPNSQDTSVPVSDRNQADATSSGNTKRSKNGWGDATSSGWGGNGSVRWGSSSWGETGEADKTAGFGWGAGEEGGRKDTTDSWGGPKPMVVDSPVEETEWNKGKGKAVPAPPRIHIPDNEHKKNKTSGSNDEPLGLSMHGEFRNLATASTPVTTSTLVATITPTDSSRVKRKRDAAFDDKLDVFKEYLRTWERGVRARFSLAEAETKRDRWFRTQKSVCYARIGEAGRKKLDEQRAECDKEVNLQRDKLSSAITSLVEFHDTFSSNLDLGQRYNISEEAEKFITESKAFVDEVRALLVANVLNDTNDASTIHTQLSGTNTTLVDSLRSQIRDLEERFDQAQTELTLRHQRDIRSEIEELLTAKVTAFRAARQREIDRIAPQPCAETVIPPDALGKMEGTAQQVRELDAKMPRTVEDIRVLLLRVDATTKRINQLEEELSMNKATYTKQMQEMVTEREEIERRMDERLEKIREQFQRLATLQGPGVLPAMSSAVCNSRDRLMESLRPGFEAVLDKFYEQEVRPTVETLQQVVIDASHRHQEEAIRVLWGKIQPAMNMVAGVSRWLDSQELGLTAPVQTDYPSSHLEQNFHS